jgi:hypothetical protein
MNVIAPKKPKGAISAEEMERRREALRRADTDHRIEGLSRTPESEPIFAAFVRGVIELHEILPRVKALYHRL